MTISAADEELIRKTGMQDKIGRKYGTQETRSD
jgi:hypothetical protein